MQFRVIQKMPQGILVEVPASLVSSYGGRKVMQFAGWKEASRAFSKEARRIERAKLNDHFGTCPLKDDLTPVYQSKPKAFLESKPKTYKTFGRV